MAAFFVGVIRVIHDPHPLEGGPSKSTILPICEKGS